MGMIERIVMELGPWNWWVLGLVLLALEVFVPGAVFLWFGVSAIIVGTIALLVPLTWQWALLLFAVLSLVSLFVGRRLVLQMGERGGDPHLNRRGSRYVGRVFVLTQPLDQGSGSLSIDDTVWRITGPDLPVGSRVRVESVSGAVLVVTPVSGEGEALSQAGPVA